MRVLLACDVAETPEDPHKAPSGDPFDAPLPLAPPADPLVAPVISSPPASSRPPLSEPLGAVDDALRPFAPEAEGGGAPPPVSFAPESVRTRDAADLPFALSPGGFSAPSPMGDAAPDLDDNEGIPTGLPDLRTVAGIEVPEPATPPPAPAPSASPSLPSELDEDLMALPSPSMVEPSPFADDEESEDDPVPELPETLDDVVVGHRTVSLHEDETQEDQLPPTPLGGIRRDGTDVVPARVMLEALQAAERRHIVHLAVAFSLGAASSVLGFVAARWAMTNL